MGGSIKKQSLYQIWTGKQWDLRCVTDKQLLEAVPKPNSNRDSAKSCCSSETAAHIWNIHVEVSPSSTGTPWMANGFHFSPVDLTGSPSRLFFPSPLLPLCLFHSLFQVVMEQLSTEHWSSKTPFQALWQLPEAKSEVLLLLELTGHRVSS